LNFDVLFQREGIPSVVLVVITSPSQHKKY
jgi:hypothetical protein